MSLKNVQAFYKRLATDEAFHTQIQGVKNQTKCSQIVKAAGYDFTRQEYEEYTAQLLELETNEGELKELEEKELEAVLGGASTLLGIRLYVQPKYGVVQPDFEL